MANLLLTTFGTRGNSVPFVRLGNALQRRGSTVQMWTNAPYARVYSDAAITLHPIDSDEEYEAFLSDITLLNKPRSLIEMYRRHYLPKVVREFRLMEQHLKKGLSVLVAHDSPGIAARLLAEKYRLPLVSILTYPNQLLLAPVMRELICHRLASDINRLRVEVGLTALPSLSVWWDGPSHYLALWPRWFTRETNAPTLEKTSCIGFLYQDDSYADLPAECERFLAGPGKKILITGGTARLATPELFHIVAQASQAANARALIVHSAPLTALPPNVVQVTEVPSLAALMRRVDAVVHHGGMGTIGQALAVATPQLILADGGDRPENACIVQALGVGRVLMKAEWKIPTIAQALRSVLSSEAMARCASERSQDCDDSRGIAVACDVIEKLLRRARIVETCAFVRQKEAGELMGYAEIFANVQSLVDLPPERRYLIARAVKRRRP